MLRFFAHFKTECAPESIFMCATRQIPPKYRSLYNPILPGYTFRCKLTQIFAPDGLGGAKYRTVHNSLLDILLPAIMWLRKNPCHSGKCGRMPRAKWDEVTSHIPEGTLNRAWGKLKAHKFVAKTVHQHEKYIEFAYWDGPHELRHIASMKARRKAGDRRRARAKRGELLDKKDDQSETHDGHKHHFLGNVSHKNKKRQPELRPRKQRLFAPALNMTEEDHLRAERGLLPPVLSSAKKISVQQSPQAASDQQPRPAGITDVGQEAGKPAVKAIENFLKRMPAAEAYRAWGAQFPQKTEDEEKEEEQSRIEADQARIARLTVHRQPDHLMSVPSKKLSDDELLVQTVNGINRDFGLALNVHKVRCSRVSMDDLVDAAYFTSRKHAATPFTNLDGAVMNAAIRRKQGIWGPKKAA